MHLQLGMDPVEDGDDWMEDQWEKWLTHEFSLDEFEDEDLSEVTEITDQYQEENDVTSWPANSVALREEGPWDGEGAGLSLELIDAEEGGGEEEEEEEEEAQGEEAKGLVRAKERLSRLDATTGRGEEKQQQEEVEEDAGRKGTLSFGGGRPSCVVMDTHRPKRPTTLALFPHQQPPPRSQDTINNNSLGKKDSWKDSQPSSPHITGDPPPAQEDKVQPGKRRPAPKPPRANSSTEGKTTSAPLHTGPDAHAPPHGTLPPGTAPEQHANAPWGQQRGGWGRGRGRGGGGGRGVVVASTRGDTGEGRGRGEGVKAERRGGRLCEGRDRSAPQNPREQGPGKRPPRVEDIKEAGGTRGGARGRGQGKINSFHDQTICLTAMVVPRTPVAPRKQDKSQGRPDKTLGKQDKSQIKQDKSQVKQDKAQGKLDNKTQDKTWLKQDNAQVKQDKTQLKQDKTQVKTQVKQDKTQNKTQFKQDRIQVKQDNTKDRIQVKQDNRQDRTQQWSQESDPNNDIAQDCPTNLSRSSSEASSNRMSLSSDTEGPPPGPLHPTHPDRTNPDISEEEGEGEPTPSNCLNGVSGHLDNNRETDHAKSRARGVDSGHGGVHQHGGVSVSSDHVRGHPVANRTAPNREAFAGLNYDSIKYTLVVDEHAQLELVRLKDCHHGYKGRDDDSDTETVYQSANEDEDPDYEQERKRKVKDEEKNSQERRKDERKREEERRRREEYVTICRQPKGMSTTTSEEEVSKGGRVGVPRSRKFLNVVVNGGSNYNATGAESFGMFSCVLDGMERQQSHRAVYRFVPRHADELHLETDDPVLILAQSEDLWCQGYNMRTGATGIFPAYYAVRVPKESSKGHTDGWIERFSVRFLGSVQVPFHKGNDVLCVAMQKVASNRRAMQRPSACVLEVSVRGLKISVQDQCHSADRGEQCFHFFHLKNISFCGCHPKHSKYFGFITKHPDQQRFACHVMMSEMTSLPLAESVGRAFQQYYKEHIGYSCPTEDIFIE